MRTVHGSCVGKQAGSGDERGWRGDFAEQLGYPRELAMPRLLRHRRLSCPQSLPVLCAHGEGQTKDHNQSEESEERSMITHILIAAESIVHVTRGILV
jgi:hypothetical protein